MKLLRLLPLLAVLLWGGAAFAADPNSGLAVTPGTGTTLCAFTGTGTITQVYTCTLPIIQSPAGVGAPVSATNPMPITSVVPAGQTAETCYGNLSSTTAATPICASPGSGKTLKIAQLYCWNSSGSTITVTLNDTSSTQIILPQTFGNNITFSVGIPLTVATNTAFTGTPSASIASAGCGAGAYNG